MARKPLLGSRAFWLRQMRQWHWISAAICLIGMLLFAITGITLNHASKIEARPVVTAITKVLPPELLQQLKANAAERQDRAAAGLGGLGRGANVGPDRRA